MVCMGLDSVAGAAKHNTTIMIVGELWEDITLRFAFY